MVSIPERVWGGLEPGASTVAGGLVWFQSLRGFGVGWSGCFELDRACHSRIGLVSIPERVWGGLEHPGAERKAQGSSVSIPERVWGGLERIAATEPDEPYSEFQSLRGFGVGWSLDRHRVRARGWGGQYRFNP